MTDQRATGHWRGDIDWGSEEEQEQEEKGDK